MGSNVLRNYDQLSSAKLPKEQKKKKNGKSMGLPEILQDWQ